MEIKKNNESEQKILRKLADDEKKFVFIPRSILFNHKDDESISESNSISELDNEISSEYQSENLHNELQNGSSTIYQNDNDKDEDIVIHTQDRIPDSKLIAAYVFFWKHSDKNNEIAFSINKLVSWCGFKPDPHHGMINDVFIEIIKKLIKNEYIKMDENLLRSQNSKLIKAEFNIEKYLDLIDKEHFAMVYLDEIKKIMSYNFSTKNRLMTKCNLLTVFSYLRYKIVLRSMFSNEEENPEVYYRYYRDISDETGINPKILSELFTILQNDLGIIYRRHIKKQVIRNGKKVWITTPTVFCNMYRRINGNLICSGEDYYLKEIRNHAKKIRSTTNRSSLTRIEEMEENVDWMSIYMEV